MFACFDKQCSRALALIRGLLYLAVVADTPPFLASHEPEPTRGRRHQALERVFELLQDPNGTWPADPGG